MGKLIKFVAKKTNTALDPLKTAIEASQEDTLEANQSRLRLVEEQNVQLALQKSLIDNYPTSVPREVVGASSSSVSARVTLSLLLPLPVPVPVPEPIVADVEIDNSKARSPRDEHRA
ncbi:hypothetical protein K7X08_032348 [Anisodus acutangulus]|uniref:Uncharacterized protein n=1 Tax=Anisodus acutangulus TaxID=402998 RepID=A0A9Q1R9G2_9SOLA|nr:hypothetical protein K7X08_032348 [Anisodus acutangulus]